MTDRPRSGMRIVLFFLVFLMIGIGVGLVSGEADSKNQYSIEHTGEAKDIVPSSDIQIITDIRIYSSEGESQSSGNLSLYIDISDISNNGLNMSTANPQFINVSNGKLTNSETVFTENESYMKMDITHLDTSEPLTIHQMKIENFGAEHAGSSSQFRYELFVTDSELESDFTSIKADSHTVNSNDFKIAKGAFEMPDQATMSSHLSDNDITYPSVSMKNITSNVNSTICCHPRRR